MVQSVSPPGRDLAPEPADEAFRAPGSDDVCEFLRSLEMLAGFDDMRVDVDVRGEPAAPGPQRLDRECISWPPLGILGFLARGELFDPFGAAGYSLRNTPCRCSLACAGLRHSGILRG